MVRSAQDERALFERYRDGRAAADRDALLERFHFKSYSTPGYSLSRKATLDPQVAGLLLTGRKGSAASASAMFRGPR